MEFRYLGNSGLKVSEIIYGNWLTHASQVEDKKAIKTVHAALEVGITTFDTADVYANQAAEVVLGQALRNQRREGIEIFTKVYWPVAEKGPNDVGLSRKHIFESLHGSLKRLNTDYIDLYQAHRFDFETPLEETMQAFADLVRQGKVHYIGVSEWTADQIKAGKKLADALGFRLISNQPQYSMLWRVIEAQVIPTSKELGISQIVWSPIAQGVLTGKYLPGAAIPSGTRAADPTGSGFIEKFMSEEVLTKVQRLLPLAQELGLEPGQLAIAWVLQNENVAAAIVGASKPEQITANAKATGVKIPAEIMQKIDDILHGSVITDPALTQSPPTRP